MRYIKSMTSFFLAACFCLPLANANASEVVGCELESAKELARNIDMFWLKRDAKGMASLYAGNATFAVEPGLGVATGRAEVQRFFEQTFATLPPNNEHLITISRVTPIGNLCAMDARATAGALSKNDANALKFSSVYLFKSEGKKLQIQAIRAVLLK